MYQWERQIQSIVDEIDRCIRQQDSEALTLQALGPQAGLLRILYHPKVRGDLGHAASGLSAGQEAGLCPEGGAGQREKPAGHCWRMAFLPRGVHRAFRRAYGVPLGSTGATQARGAAYQLRPIDRYFFGTEEIGMIGSCQGVKIYFVTIPAHKFLYLEDRESNGYWDFWQRQAEIPGQDYDTVCGLLDSIKGKLDDSGGSEANCGSGQIMAYRNDPKGRLCGWGIPGPSAGG